MTRDISSKRRSIPRSTIVDIQTSSSQRGALSDSDSELTLNIVAELKASGIIREVETMRGIKSQEELTQVLRDAEDHSLDERELNPDYHDERVDQMLTGLDGGSNPLMQKFDDYEGLDYNPAFRARDNMRTARDGRSSPGRKKKRIL